MASSIARHFLFVCPPIEGKLRHNIVKLAV